MRALALALFSTVFLAPAQAADGENDAPAANQPEIRKTLDKMDSEPALSEFFPACPSEYFGKAATLFDALGNREGLEEEYCAKHPLFCLTECVQGKNSDTCFGLARAIQDHADPAAPIYTEKLFAFSCAAGKPSACTNRGAGMRNGRYDGDPALAWTDEKLNGCLMRTFQLTCDKGDSWGCAMLGQAWQAGEGAAANAEKAKAAYKRACNLAPDFPSCEFASSMMEVSGAE